MLDEAAQKLSKLKGAWVDWGYFGASFARVVKQVCGKRVEVEVINEPQNSCYFRFFN